MSEITLAVLQLRCDESRRRNEERTLERIAEAAASGAQVICLQELFSIRYPCQREDHAKFDEAEPIPGPTTELLSRAAAQHGVVVVASLFERRAPGVYHNSAAVLDADGTPLGLYRKMHIPDDPGYYEKFFFAPGDLGFRAFETRFGKIGVCICWDQWFPEAARLTVLAGAELLLYPTAIGWLPDEKDEFGASQWNAWETMMRSHAIANGVFVAAANRVGHEEGIEFWGGSFIADPNGNVLSRGDHEQEQVVTAKVNLAQVDAVRTHWPFLRDRRIDAYGGLTQRMNDRPFGEG